MDNKGKTNGGSSRKNRALLNEIRAVAGKPLAVAARKPGPAKKSRSTVGPTDRRIVSAASAYAVGQRSSEPKRVFDNKRKSFIVAHRELLASVTGSTNFTINQQIAIQPGLSASFPWLSTQAIGYEQYRFRKLRFCYYTRTGSNVPGSCMLIVDYDAADAAPANEQVASAYRDSEEVAPWVPEFCLDADIKALHPDGNRKFIRTGTLAANLDVKTYDCGNFYVATVDGTAVNWGKLWVEYEIEFFVPQLPALGSSQVSVAINGGTSSTTNPFGSAPTITNGSELALTIAAGVVSFAGAIVGAEYSFNYSATGTGLGLYSWATPVGLTLKTAIASGATNTAGTVGSAQSTYTATAASGSLTLVQASLTTVTNTLLTVSRIPTVSL